MTTPSAPEWINHGLALQQQGRMDEAVALYQRVLAQEPQNPLALLFLGIVTAQRGQAARGVELMRQAGQLQPQLAPAHESLAHTLEMLGQAAEAQASYERLIALAPGHDGAYAGRARTLEAQGRLPEALRDFDKALSLKADPATAISRGMLLLKLKRPQEALDGFDMALSLGFQHPVLHFNRGVVLTELGRAADAVAAFDRALALQPTPDGWNSRGAALQSLERWDEALRSFEAALTLKSDYAQVWANRGAVLARLDRLEDALASFARAAALAPHLADAFRQHARLADQLGHYRDAAASYARLIALEPQEADAYLERGRILCTGLNQVEEALATYDALLARHPQSGVAHADRGNAWLWGGKPDRAIIDYERAVALSPDVPQMWINRARGLIDLGRFEEAHADLDKAIALDGTDSGAPFVKSLLLLLQGRYGEGWPLYEQRIVKRKPAGRRLRPGDNIAGKRLFVQWEQGHGDVFHFARFAQKAQVAGAHVTLAVPENMMRLMRGLTPAVALLGGETVPENYDFHVPLLSLAHYFGVEDETIPASVPYLTAEPQLVAQWKARIGENGFRVGLCWQGKLDPDPTRSFPLAAAAPLAAVPGVRLISLQHGHGNAQREDPALGFTVESLGPGFNAGEDAFIDSAAAMCNLDLIISCDTAALHLAGALGRPVWAALKCVPDWRYQMARKHIPWYPTMTLFRQPVMGDWDRVFQDMAAQLAALQPAAALR